MKLISSHFSKARILSLCFFSLLSSNNYAEKLVSAGSSTLSPLMNVWKQAYTQQKGIDFDVTSNGSSSAIKALIEGTANFGSMSRTMSHKETRQFVQAGLAKPVRI